MSARPSDSGTSSTPVRAPSCELGGTRITDRLPKLLSSADAMRRLLEMGLGQPDDGAGEVDVDGSERVEDVFGQRDGYRARRAYEFAGAATSRGRQLIGHDDSCYTDSGIFAEKFPHHLSTPNSQFPTPKAPRALANGPPWRLGSWELEVGS